MCATPAYSMVSLEIKAIILRHKTLFNMIFCIVFHTLKLLPIIQILPLSFMEVQEV